MPSFFDLPPELQIMIVNNLSTPNLFDLITEKIKPNQIINTAIEINENSAQGSLEVFNKILRHALFGRRGPQASRYQSSILNSWLHYWSREKKLSFIKNHADKKEWLRLIDAALRDPLSSYEHKIRCCLYINALFPNSQNMSSRIIQSIMTKVSNKSPVTSELKAFGSQLSQTNMHLIITSLRAQNHGHDNRENHEAAALALGAIAPHLSKPQNDAAFIALLDKLNFIDPYVRRAATIALSALPHASTAVQLDAMFIADLVKLKNGKEYTLCAAASKLSELAPHVSTAQCDAAITALLSILNDAQGYVRQAAVTALGSIAPHSSTTQCDAVITAILARLSDEYRTVRQAAATALGAIAPHSSTAQYEWLEWLIPALLARLNHTNSYIVLDSVIALGAIAPHFSKTRCDEVITALLIKLNAAQWSVRQAAATALSAIAPYASKTQCDAAFIALIAQLSDGVPVVREAVATAMGAVVHFASKTRCDAAIIALLPQVNDTIWRGIHRAATAALGAIAPYASTTQCNAAFIALLAQWNNAKSYCSQATAIALGNIIPTLTNTQLKKLLEVPDESSVEKMSLQFIVQTRLHMNNPEWNPKRDLGRYFSRNNHRGILTERKFDQEAKIWNEPRTLRLWSEISNKRQTVDDCMTVVKRNDSSRYHEI